HRESSVPPPGGLQRTPIGPSLPLRRAGFQSKDPTIAPGVGSRLPARRSEAGLRKDEIIILQSVSRPMADVAPSRTPRRQALQPLADRIADQMILLDRV